MTKAAVPANMAAWARRYIEVFGLALVAIEPGQKAPKGNGWNKPGGYLTDPDAAEAFWTKHPKHNMGVVHGPSRVCSLDVDHVEYTRQVLMDLLGVDLDALAVAYPTVVGNPERFRVLFRVPDGLELSRHSLSWPNPNDPDGSKHRLATKALKQAREEKDQQQIEAMQAQQREFSPVTVFELRAGTVQDVLPPSIHPDTGKPYIWRNPPPAEGLLELPRDLVNIWTNWDIFKRDALAACAWAPSAAKPPAKAKKAPPRKEAGDQPSVIDAFNRGHDVEALLQRHGYIKRGRKWLAPQSSTGLPGVSVVEQPGEPSRVFSHHGSDPLANGHMNDPFDVFCILEHNGDTSAAIKAAARAMGLEHKRSGPRPPEPPPVGGSSVREALEQFDALMSDGAEAAGDGDGDLPPAPPSDGDSAAKPGTTESGGAGGGPSLNSLLRRYALVEGTTHVWDYDQAKKMKQSAFVAHVGKESFKAWSAVIDPKRKKRVSEEWVRDIERAQLMAGKAVGDAAMPMMIRYVYIDGTKDAWDYAKKRRIPEGAVKMALGDAYSLWLNSPDRRVVDMNHIVFDPTSTLDPEVYINTYEGLPLLPKRDDAACENLRWLIEFLCNHDTAAATWLIRWLAYPLQHSGAKMDTAVLMHSTQEGSGKSLLFSVALGRLYGQYSATVGQTQLEGSFNAWQSGKLWAVFEEVVSRDQKYNQVGKIKQLITGQTVRIESKFVNGWEEASHMNAVFLSNEIVPWPISDSDRRFLVMWPEEKLPPERQKAIKHELEHGGVEALYAWLLAQDLGDFDQQTKPPSTPARERLVALSRAPWQTFIHLWRTAQLGDGLWGGCLSSDLYALFLEWCHRNKEHSMSQTKFSLFIETMGVEKTRAIPWTERTTRRFSAWLFPKDDQSFLPPSTKAADLGKHVEEWRTRARLAGWNVDGWDHVKGATP
ncbi:MULTISPECIES: bifunctional DNA primase/polymerase [unclassified Pseudomonas]|uniref:bifunctional DNA primase/polymerase n=1 Tax=unclassified Pseudomonas TaxID=196821 RepID=UPI00244C2679|nr:MULTISPECIES: bifunctional DNA primase/polymerase [unclassified Pseudomonas]MDH0894238.1 bifunctional DNA primase/polymerase [Pseudomonas sp. GD03875]MDH1063467.1 bifunctional DNA primase/polymerase [Pseudomonas sp. GD03985]